MDDHTTVIYRNCQRRLTLSIAETLMNSTFDKPTIIILSDIGIKTLRSINNSKNTYHNSHIITQNESQPTFLIIWPNSMHIRHQQISPFCIKLQYRNTTTLATYLPPSAPSHSLEQLFDCMKRFSNPTIIIGDINARLGPITMDNYTNNRGKLVKKLMNESNSETLNKEPSTNLSSKSVVDLVIGNTLGKKVVDKIITTNDGVLTNIQSDHKCLIVQLTHTKRSTQSKPTIYRINTSYIRRLNHHRYLISKHKNHDKTRCKKCKSILILDMSIQQTSATLKKVILEITRLPDIDNQSIIDCIDNILTSSIKHSNLLAAGIVIAKNISNKNKDISKMDIANMLKHISNEMNPKTICPLDPNDQTTQKRFFPEKPSYITASNNSDEEMNSRTDDARLTVVDGITENESKLFNAHKLSNIIKHMPKRKAPGHDSIHHEHIQSSTFTPSILELHFNTCLQLRCTPSSWKLGRMIPVYKGKGPRTDPKSYRPLQMIPTIRKVWELSIYNTLEEQARLSPIQGGFVRKRGTLENILMLHQHLQTGFNEQNGHQKFTTVLLDIRGAFDHVNRAKLMNLVEQKLQEKRIAHLLKTMYTTSYSYLDINNMKGDITETYEGTHQGSPLSPLLWNLYLDQVSPLLPQHKLSETPDPNLLILFYADDIVISGTSAKVQFVLDLLYSFAQTMDIEFSPEKCIQLGPGDTEINGCRLLIAETAKYLGIQFNKFGIDMSHATTTANKVIATINHMHSRLPMRKLNLEKRIIIFKTFIRPKLEYASQIAPILQIDEQRLAHLHRRMMKWVIPEVHNFKPHIVGIILDILPPSTRFGLSTILFNMKHYANNQLQRNIANALKSITNNQTISQIYEHLITAYHDWIKQKSTFTIDEIMKARKFIIRKAGRLLSYEKANIQNLFKHQANIENIGHKQIFKLLDEDEIQFIINNIKTEKADQILSKIAPNKQGA